MKPLIVIVSRDAQFYLLLAHILEVDGFAAAPANSIDDVLGLAQTDELGAVLLDCRKNSRNVGFAEELRHRPSTRDIPIIALLAAGAEKQQFDLIKAGVIERIVGPFVPLKLLEHLRQIMKHELAESAADDTVLRYRDVEMNLSSHRVNCGSVDVSLGPIEYNILKILLESPKRVFRREELLVAVWPEGSDVDRRNVDVHVSQLRIRLMKHSNQVTIRTVRLVGYALDDRPQSSGTAAT